jgi:hypothetical protein
VLELERDDRAADGGLADRLDEAREVVFVGAVDRTRKPVLQILSGVRASAVFGPTAQTSTSAKSSALSCDITQSAAFLLKNTAIAPGLERISRKSSRRGSAVRSSIGRWWSSRPSIAGGSRVPV